MTAVTIPVLNRCTKLNLFRAMRVVQMTPTAARVLQFLIDDETAWGWSLRRFGHAVGKHPRTIDGAVAELKQLGFIDVLYRRRQTAIKVLRVDAILTATSRAVAVAKQAAKAAISMFRRGFQASQKSATNIHLDILGGAESAPWRKQEAPSASLLRSLGMRVGARRR